MIYDEHSVAQAAPIMTNAGSKERSDSARQTFVISRARISDAQAIAKLGAAEWIRAFAWSVSPTDCDSYINTFYTPHAWEKELQDPNSITFLVRFHSHSPSTSPPATSDPTPFPILGFAQVKFNTTEPCLSHLFPNQTAELHRIYVSSTHQNLGIGRSLFNYIHNFARNDDKSNSSTNNNNNHHERGETKFRYLWLGVWEENKGARRLYEREGYAVVGDHDFVIGDDVQKDLIMVKEL